jgi:phosphohistidine phosphatase
MKSLLLLRHAKSSWKDPNLADHERPLKGRGRRAAALIGRFMASNNLQPDLVLSSTAVRARETLEIVLDSAQFTVEVGYDDRLYLADSATLMDVVAQLDSGKQEVLLVGHNPSMEEFLFRLTGIRESMPTAALAHILLETEKWGEVSAKNSWRLERLVKPKELAPS